MAHDSDDGSEDDAKGTEPKGTKYGFARIDSKGEQVEDPKAQLPAPGSKRQETPTEAAADAPVLRRVEHELAEPARLTASTHAGREILREQVEAGLPPAADEARQAEDHIDGLMLQSVKAEDLIKHDLLEANRPSALRRGLQHIAWTRFRLIGAIAAGAVLVLVVIVLIALRCGGSPHEPPLVGGHLPGEEDGGVAAAESKGGATRDDSPADPQKPSDYVVQIAAARKLVEQNFCQDAAKMLLPVLRGKKPTKQNAEGYYLLGRSLVCGGKERAGLVAYERALTADAPRYRQDKAMLADMGYLLTRDKLQEPTIRVVTERIGAPAKEIMLAAATHDLLAIRSRAVAALERIDPNATIDWQTSLWLDLQQQTCDKRPAVIEKIAQKLPAKTAVKLLRAAVDSPKQQCVGEQLKQQLAKLSPRKKSPEKKKQK